MNKTPNFPRYTSQLYGGDKFCFFDFVSVTTVLFMPQASGHLHPQKKEEKNCRLVKRQGLSRVPISTTQYRCSIVGRKKQFEAKFGRLPTTFQRCVRWTAAKTANKKGGGRDITRAGIYFWPIGIKLLIDSFRHPAELFNLPASTAYTRVHVDISSQSEVSIEGITINLVRTGATPAFVVSFLTPIENWSRVELLWLA